MTRYPISIMLPEDVSLSDVDARAKERGMTRSAFSAAAIKLVMDMDPDVLAQMEKLAADLKIPVGLVISNKLIKLLALEDARNEVSGAQRVLLHEFMFTDKGPLTGQALYDELKGLYLEFEAMFGDLDALERLRQRFYRQEKQATDKE